MYRPTTCEHKQSPVSNSVRHSLTESCLPFISIWQCPGSDSRRSRSGSSILAPARLLFAFYCILFLMRCFICNFVQIGGSGKGLWLQLRLRTGSGSTLAQGLAFIHPFFPFSDARSCTRPFWSLQPLQFQFISSIFSFGIHIFLTKVLWEYIYTVFASAPLSRSRYRSGTGAGKLFILCIKWGRKNLYKGKRQVWITQT